MLCRETSDPFESNTGTDSPVKLHATTDTDEELVPHWKMTDELLLLTGKGEEEEAPKKCRPRREKEAEADGGGGEERNGARSATKDTSTALLESGSSDCRLREQPLRGGGTGWKKEMHEV